MSHTKDELGVEIAVRAHNNSEGKKVDEKYLIETKKLILDVKELQVDNDGLYASLRVELEHLRSEDEKYRTGVAQILEGLKSEFELAKTRQDTVEGTVRTIKESSGKEAQAIEEMLKALNAYLKKEEHMPEPDADKLDLPKPKPATKNPPEKPSYNPVRVDNLWAEYKALLKEGDMRSANEILKEILECCPESGKKN